MRYTYHMRHYRPWFLRVTARSSKRVLAIVEASVSPSVRPQHLGIVSKRRK